MARIRDPAREKAYTLWKEAGGRKAPKGILKEIAKILNKSESLIRKWKNTDEWDNGNVTNNTDSNITNGNGNVTNRKSLIKQAKSMVVSGNTLKEISTKLNINENTLRTYSAKEKWIDQQEKFFQKVYKELQDNLAEQHISDRKNTIMLLHNLMIKTILEEKNDTATIKGIALRDNIINLVLKSIKGQSELLGIPEMKLYIRQDNKEDKNIIGTTINRDSAMKMLKKARGIKNARSE